MADILCIGKIMQDIIVRTKEAKDIYFNKQNLLALPYKEKINLDHISFCPGGGAANCAVGMAKLGNNAKILAAVGNDPEGDEIINMLRVRFIKTDLIQKVEERTGVSIIISPQQGSNDYTVLIYRGANAKLGEGYEIDKLAINDADAWYISSLGMSDLNFLNRLIEEKKEEIKIAFNPGALQINLGLTDLQSILAKTEVLILNKQEAEKLSGKTQLDAFKTLKDAGAKIIAITDGKNGAAVFDGEKLFLAKAYPANVIEALGAGDAFGATFFATYLETEDLEKSFEYAMVNCSAALEKVGASEGVLEKSEIEKRLAKKAVDVVIRRL